MPKIKSSPSHIASDEYLEFIRSVHLTGLGMDDAGFKVDRGAYASTVKLGKTVAEISGRQEIAGRQAKSFVVFGHYKVFVKGDSGKNIVELSCKLSALFSLDRRSDLALVERFANNEAVLVFWPYLRHFVSDSTYRMSIGPLQLPLTPEMELTKA